MIIQIHTEIEIKATTEKVWAILTDFKNYPNWNPFIKSINGDVKAGNKIMIKIEPPQSKGMTFQPKVLSYEYNKEFSWLGHLIFPGLFDGAHKFEIIDNKKGTTTFRQSEKFSGILISLFKKELNINTKKGFELMNIKLKELAELR